MSINQISVENLRNILEDGKDWMKIPVKGLPAGILIIRIPAFFDEDPARLVIGINPLKEDGIPEDERAFNFLMSRKELEDLKSRMSSTKREAYLKLLSYEMLSKLLENIEKVNPKVERREQKAQNV